MGKKRTALFEMQAELAGELRKGPANAAVREMFKGRGHPLLERADITRAGAGRWSISTRDGDGTGIVYDIKLGGGKLTVYRRRNPRDIASITNLNQLVDIFEAAGKKICPRDNATLTQTRQDVVLILFVLGAHECVVADPAAHSAAFDGKICSWTRPKTFSRVQFPIPSPAHDLYVPAEPSRVVDAIERWLDPRLRAINHFPTHRDTVHDWMARVGRKARLPRPLNPDVARHTVISWLLKRYDFNYSIVQSLVQCSIKILQDNYATLPADFVAAGSQ